MLGLETDFQRSWLSGVQVEQLITTFQPGVISNPFTYTASERLTWIGTTRARVGVPIGRTLVYGTGGLAYGRVELATSTTYNTFADYRGSESLIAKGWALGGGAEFLLTDHATVRAEAIHYDLGKITIDGRSPNLPQFTESREFQIRGTILRAALNYRF